MNAPNVLVRAAAARALAGRALFGDDWIGKLTKRELDLLSGPYGPQRKTLSNGRSITIVSPCPPNLRHKLDAAIGRAERAYLQEATVIDLLHDNGFSDLGSKFDKNLFDQFLETICRPKAEAARGAGKPRDLIEGIKIRMASDMRDGIDIKTMKQKELVAKYGGSRGTAAKARQEVLEKYARQ
ncbi:hypothetical protein ACWAUC_19785 [Bradyrhizobium guangdongense]